MAGPLSLIIGSRTDYLSELRIVFFASTHSSLLRNRAVSNTENSVTGDLIHRGQEITSITCHY